MKKSKYNSKKLPKFDTAGMYGEDPNFKLYSQSDQNALMGGNGASNIYNQKRAQGFSQNQYSQMGQAITAGGLQAYNASNQKGISSLEKTRGIQAGADTAKVGVATAINPVLGMGVGAITSIGSAVQTSADKTDANGNIINKDGSKAGEIAGGLLSPSNSLIGIFSDPNATSGQKIAGALTGGISDMFTDRHKNQVESSAKEDIASQQAQQDAYNQQQAAAQQQQNDFINNSIQSGMTKYQNQNKGSYVQYPNGGVNMLPNAEVEKEENSVAPNGQFTQYNGPSHGQGGIKTNLEPGEMIFSDKLKLGNKTFAQLNKANNTNKQDKILDNPNSDRISKKTAELLRMAKLKNSEILFKQQEDLKQSKVFNYAKKMGVNLFTDNEQSEDRMKYGGLQMYHNGGLTPGQYKQAQADSMLLYNAGLKSNKIPSFQYPGAMEAAGRLAELNGTAPNTIKGEFYNNQPNYTGGYNVEFKKPTMLPYQEPKITSTINTPSYHPKYNSYIPGIDKSKQPVNIEQFKKGGKKGGRYIPQTAQYNPQDDIIVPGVPKSNTDFSNVLAPNPYDKQMDSTDANTLNKSAWEADYMNNPNADYSNFNQQKYNEDLVAADSRIEDNNFDWNKLGTQVGLGIANNAGNIYNLIRSNKPEVTKFQRANASLVDPTAALRDATDQTRRAEYNIRGASGGNAGTYLSNRVALNAQNIVNKDRIRKEYANINAGILNQNSQFNTDIANKEYVANEQNRAQTRNIKGQAIANIGSNVVSQYKDNKAQQYDQNTLDNMSEFYNALKDDPYAKARWEKIKKGYK